MLCNIILYSHNVLSDRRCARPYNVKELSQFFSYLSVYLLANRITFISFVAPEHVNVLYFPFDTCKRIWLGLAKKMVFKYDRHIKPAFRFLQTDGLNKEWLGL